MKPYVFILIPLLAGLLAQVAKFLIFSFKHGFDWRFLLEYGHMPSSHTAMMSSLIWAIGWYGGFSSPEFAVALMVTLLIISDALRLRIYIGSYGKTLNSLLDHLRIEDYSIPPKLKERVGHKPSEVLGGLILGIATAVFIIELIG